MRWMIPLCVDAYTAQIKENIAYDDLAMSRPIDMALVNEFIGVIIDCLFTEGKNVRVDGEMKSRALINSSLMKLGYAHIEHAIDQFKGVSDRIAKKKQYMLTLLYNSTLEVDAHYTNMYSSEKWNTG